MIDKISGQIKFELMFLIAYICKSHNWKKDDVKFEATITNLKTGEKDYLNWQHPE